MKEYVILSTLYLLTAGFIEEQPMPSLLCECFSNNRYNVTDNRADTIHYKCIQNYLSQTYDERWYVNMSSSAKNYVRSLQREIVRDITRKRRKRQASTQLYHGYRKEIRTLTRTEKQAFFSAVIALKRDTSVFPNAYEAIANFHAGPALPAAHGGPAFCPWHRYYLYLFENALRRKDRRVTLCYWDSSIDNNMPDPINSNIWDAQFMGNADGVVITGPFAGWMFNDNRARLTRNSASGVGLFPSWGLDNIYSRIRNREIFEPTADNQYNIETFHNWVHSWIGGTMLDSSIAPNDPVFFLHHCFIDYVWERFRLRQAEILGAAFEYDYPRTNIQAHSPYSPFGGELRELNNINGLLALFGDVIYKYGEPIECPVCGNPDNFYCENGRCLPRRRSDIRSTSDSVGTNLGDRVKRDTDTAVPHDHFSHRSVMDETYQNSFLIDGTADISLWAFIPVRLMYKRPEGTTFNCKPIHNGQVDWKHDMYSADNTSKIREYVTTGHISGKQQKYDSGSGATKLYVQSDGFSYSGKYIDYGVIDTRQIISETIAYVGVKNPQNGSSTAYVSAYDLHGMVCQPRCLDPSSNTVYYKECSGVIKLTTDEPKMYGDDITEAVLYRYTFADDSTCPDNRNQDVFLTFVCEYKDEYPCTDCQV